MIRSGKRTNGGDVGFIVLALRRALRLRWLQCGQSLDRLFLRKLGASGFASRASSNTREYRRRTTSAMLAKSSWPSTVRTR